MSGRHPTAAGHALAEPYVPGPGAMRWELYEVRKKKPAWAYANIKGMEFERYFYVSAPISNESGCNCSKVYPIIIESLTPHNRELVYAALGVNTFTPVTCACSGRIVGEDR